MALHSNRPLRISYPLEDRPLFRMKGKEFLVVNLSASGMKMICDEKLSKGAAIAGDIDFRGRRSAKVKGSVVRKVGDLLMIHFDQQLVISLLQAEFEYLQKSYGTVKFS